MIGKMRQKLWISIILAVVGVMLVAGGVSACFIRANTVATCEACGMEVEKKDVSTFQIVTRDTKIHSACCPICALAIATYFRDASINGFCFRCGAKITIQIVNAELLSSVPSGPYQNMSIVFGKACTKNKIACCEKCAREICATYQWATGLQILSTEKAFDVAKAKVPEFKMEERTGSISGIAYSLVAAGLLLMAFAPLSRKLLSKRGIAKHDSGGKLVP